MRGGKFAPLTGAETENEVVARHLELGIEAERFPAGRNAKGNIGRGDLQVLDMRGEVKHRATARGFEMLFSWLGDRDLLFLRRPGREPLVVAPWKTYERMIRLLAEAENGEDHADNK